MTHEIITIKIGKEGYPKLLAQIPSPPKQLYCRGNTNLLNTFCFGVVGTRKLTAYGKEAAEHIINGMQESGITIVSGLAFGVDAIAHQAALNNNLPTIAVLGSGVDDKSIYPVSNLPLAKKVLKEDGLIISEYPEGTKGYKAHFPARNRIISGISKGILVVEAQEKSGSLITARSALEQGRDVFAVPGSIFALNSRGPHFLIQNGAKPVFTAEDILAGYNMNLELPLKPKINISTKDPSEKMILDILDKNGEMIGDEIIRTSGLEVLTAMAALSMLEINGRIKQRNDKYQLVVKIKKRI